MSEKKRRTITINPAWIGQEVSWQNGKATITIFDCLNPTRKEQLQVVMTMEPYDISMMIQGLSEALLEQHRRVDKEIELARKALENNDE